MFQERDILFIKPQAIQMGEKDQRREMDKQKQG